jgi:predicted XRE-type DNA-binding protein
MSRKLEVVRGSGNAFADVGLPNTDAEYIKAKLAAELIRTMRERKLTAVAASKLTGATEADISRIRSAELGRFSIDRMVRILNGLDQRVTVTVGPFRGGGGRRAGTRKPGAFPAHP